MSGTWWIGLDELSEEQQDIIDVDLDESHLVTGPAGSGKTNLLLLRAQYVVRAGRPNIQVVVFTKSLREFIASGAERYAFDRSRIVTSQSFMLQFLIEHGEAIGTLPKKFEDSRLALVDRVQALIARRHLRDVYECILLDEAQDYLAKEIEIFSILGKTLFAVGDSRQRIYNKADEDQSAALRASVDRQHSLKHHFRCGLNICRLADGIAKVDSMYAPMVDTSNYDEKARPSRVEHFKCDNLERQCDLILSALDLQRRAYPDELLGVVCWKNSDLGMIWARIEASPLGPVAMRQGEGERGTFDRTKQVCVSTIHAAKGVEFRALHVAACDSMFRTCPNNRNLTYTAVTRAKTSLSLYYAGTIHGYLQQAIVQFGPRPGRPRKKDLFGPVEEGKS